MGVVSHESKSHFAWSSNSSDCKRVPTRLVAGRGNFRHRLSLHAQRAWGRRFRGRKSLIEFNAEKQRRLTHGAAPDRYKIALLLAIDINNGDIRFLRTLLKAANPLRYCRQVS
jgi:hypothetical protein